mgnify:CR=1 FL=1
MNRSLYKLIKITEGIDIVWMHISRYISSFAIYLLSENPDKINWIALSMNPNAIHLLSENPDKINWCSLSENPNAIHMLEANPSKIYWNYMIINTNTFEREL